MLLPPFFCRLVVASPDEMTAFGHQLSALLSAGNFIGLKGALGAGKSTLARAMISAALDQLGIDAGDIPSPSFTLVQPYPFPGEGDAGREIWHLDLWRLEDPDDMIELGVEEALERHVSLVEWPERMARLIPGHMLLIQIDKGALPHERVISIHGDENWARRLQSAGIDPSA